MERRPDSQVSIYDQVAFPSYPFPQSHPERLATIARLCGLTTAQVDRCRVLELGCGAGGNLLPMADWLPCGEFLGIDLSDQQVAIGREQIAAAGLTNVRLEARDILSLDETLGRFDFVIAHGVYSWTTDAVRDKILALCRLLLVPNGVAYVNYNTYPGWHVQGMLRDMLYFHSQSFGDPAERVLEARRMIEFLVRTLPAQSTPFGSLVRSELDAIQRNPDPFLYHAYLNVVNQPFYWHEFQQRAAMHGLRYLGDAEPDATWPERAAPPLAASVRELNSDESRWPQYFDFVRFTTSRRSLLCHQEVEVERGPRLAALRDLHVSAALRPADKPDASASVSFVTRGGRTVSTGDPRLQMTLQRLADTWPGSIPFEELAQWVQVAAAPSNSLQSLEAWQHELLHGFCHQVLGLSVWPSPASKTIPGSPQAPPLVRCQAASRDFVVNRRHETVRLQDPDRRCLQLLDGTRTLDDLTRQLGENARESLARITAAGLLHNVARRSAS